MLHVSLRDRQAAPRFAVLLATALLAAWPSGGARAQQPTGADQAAVLARSGQHAEAARLYEQSARRGFFSWDARLALLAAREYTAARQYGDAERMLNKAEGRARGDDAVLLAAVEAEVALAKNDPRRALAALRALPEPWPAPMAPDLLALRGRAQFAAGFTLDGIRSYTERGRVLGAAEARTANDRELVNLLRQYPPSGPVPPGATDGERAWLELGNLLATAGTTEPLIAAQHARDWLMRHPGHPGAAFLPLGTAPPAARGTAAPAPAVPSAASVALLLPVSGRQQAAGLAVRDGAVAAWLASPEEGRPTLRVYDTAGGALAAYQRAINDGNAVILGPLTREDVAAVAAQPIVVPTVALNAYGGPTPPPFLYQFSLDPEQEARAVARRISADGLVRGIALYPDSPWGQRIAAAFSAELQATGTTVLMASQYYEPGAKDFSDELRAVLGRFGGAGDRPADHRAPPPKRDPVAEAQQGPQFAFVAATPQTMRALRPQLRFQMTYDLPIYSTSDAWDASVRSAADMDGLVYPEMPWVLFSGQGAPELWDAVNTTWARTARGRLRLYAFGYDAYRLAGQVQGSSRTLGLDGLTGELTVGTDGRVERRLQFARVEGGRPQPIGAGLPPLPAPAPGDGTP